MKSLHIITICLVFAISYTFGGCIAKSSVVDENSRHITDTLVILNKHFPEDKDVVNLYNEAVNTEEKGSEIINKFQVAKAIKMGAKVAAKSTGWPIEGIVGTLVAIFLGAERLTANKRQRKKLKAVGDLSPEEAKKVTNVI